MGRVPGNWLLSPGFDYTVPVHAIEFRIEVFGFDKAAHLLEYGFPVAAAETNHVPKFPQAGALGTRPQLQLFLRDKAPPIVGEQHYRNWQTSQPWQPFHRPFQIN